MKGDFFELDFPPVDISQHIAELTEIRINN
jgi:hypothetical protein